MTPQRVRRLGTNVVVASMLSFVASPMLGAGPAAADPIADKTAEAARIARQLQALGIRVEQLVEALDQAKLQADTIQTNMAATQARLTQTEARASQTRGVLRAQALTMYVTGGRGAAVQAVMGGSPSDIVIGQAYVSRAFANQQDAVDQIRSINKQLHDQQASLGAEKKSAADALARAAAAEQAAIAAQAGEQATLSKVKGELIGLVSAEQQRQAAAAAVGIQADLAARLASQAASRSRSTPSPGLGGGVGVAPGPIPAPNANAAAAIAAAQAELGKPYLWGGAGPNAFDCSGLTMWAWRAGGVALSHGATAQYQQTAHVPLSQAAPGDLIFFGSPSFVFHDGIYVGGGQMIEAQQSGTVIHYNSIYGSGLMPVVGRP